MKRRPLVRVGVFSLERTLLDDAVLRLESAESERPPVLLSFDEAVGGHVAYEVTAGAYTLFASAPGLEAQRRPVNVTDEGLDTVVLLGRPGLPYYYRGAAKVPFEPQPLIGVSLAGPPNVADANTRWIAERAQANIDIVCQASSGEAVSVLHLPGALSGEEQMRLVRELTAREGVRYAGPVVSRHRDGIAFLTNEFVVKFNATVGREEVDRQIAGAGLAILRPIPYARNAFLVQAPDPWVGLDACGRLVASSFVDYAEPNLIANAIDDSVTPTDHLVPAQWHLPLINLPGAWRELRSLNAAGVSPGDPGDLTFGSESITIAIFDRGIPSRTVNGVVSSVHPEFDGTVTSGKEKVAHYFDFLRMEPNNDQPTGDHGIRCAGVATALANNPSPVPGESEGVAGAAPNGRVIGIIRDDSGTEVHYADAYVWISGLNPQSTQAGFPQPLPSGEGADVISSSFGLANASVPISGLMSDCFDHVTTHGRNSRGVVLCFSSGDNNADFRLTRPWAAYDKTIAVGATRINDVKAGFSAFGPGLDVCAPADGGRLGSLVTCDLPGQGPGPGRIAGHTGGPPDYTRFFGGTSASTPLVAGVAALVLSANPALTWYEVRDVLCRTAAKIDLGNMDAVGRWMDTDGDGVVDFSQWYGFGRVDARAAIVEAARCRPAT